MLKIRSCPLEGEREDSANDFWDRDMKRGKFERKKEDERK
jgi:hypothetical protein